MSNRPRKEIESIITESLCYPGERSRPTKKFFILEDDSHSAEGFSYLGKQADTFEEAIVKATVATDWLYEIYRLDTMKLACKGFVLYEAHRE